MVVVYVHLERVDEEVKQPYLIITSWTDGQECLDGDNECFIALTFHGNSKGKIDIKAKTISFYLLT